MANESRNSSDEDLDENDWPSGSNWGLDQLYRLNINSEPNRLPFDTLGSRFDPLPQDLVSHIRRNLGAGLGPREADFKDFFTDLAPLCDEKAHISPNVTRTRSVPQKPGVFQSSPIRYRTDSPESSPRPGPESSQPTDLQHDEPDSPTNLSQEEMVDEDVQSLDPNIPQTPPPVPFCDTVLSSSPEDPTYVESSSPAPTDLQSGDPVEAYTNQMMATLLSLICRMVDQSSSGLVHPTKYACHPGDTLRILIDGQVVNTTPDLQIIAMSEGKTINILDYEGKRLKPSKTRDQLFAQRVSHMIGRAQFNMVEEILPEDRTIYLLNAQHTSVHVVTCTLKHHFIRQMNTDVAKLQKLRDPIEVNEYGPVDLADPEERLLCVETLAKMLSFLLRRTSLYKRLNPP